MKPRLEPCDHTEEDSYVWASVILAAGLSRFGSLLWTRSLMQDRRDSELMLEAQRDKTASVVLFRDYHPVYGTCSGTAIDVRATQDPYKAMWEKAL